MRKAEGSIRVPTPIEHPSPFRCQYCRKPALHCSWRHGLTTGQLYSQPAPTTLLWSILQESTVQVIITVVMQEVSIDSLQQQMRTFRCKVSQVRAFFLGGAHPPWRGHIIVPPPTPWGTYSPLLLFIPFLDHSLCHLSPPFPPAPPISPILVYLLS